jgi:Uma2 family endonuclease
MGISSAALKIEDLPHYIYDDYVQWEGEWEIIHGIPYAMTPAPRIKHQRLSVKIAAQLESLLKNCADCQTLMPVDWQIAEDTVVQPDLLVVCGKNKSEEKLLIPPVLVFEIISPATAKKDRILKYQLYEEAGVKYYCLVDPDANSMDIFELNRGRYRNYNDKDNFKDGKVTLEIGNCLIEFDVAEIFK